MKTRASAANSCRQTRVCRLLVVESLFFLSLIHSLSRVKRTLPYTACVCVSSNTTIASKSGGKIRQFNEQRKSNKNNNNMPRRNKKTAGGKGESMHIYICISICTKNTRGRARVNAAADDLLSTYKFQNIEHYSSSCMKIAHKILTHSLI